MLACCIVPIVLTFGIGLHYLGGHNQRSFTRYAPWYAPRVEMSKLATDAISALTRVGYEPFKSTIDGRIARIAANTVLSPLAVVHLYCF